MLTVIVGIGGVVVGAVLAARRLHGSVKAGVKALIAGGGGGPLVDE